MRFAVRLRRRTVGADYLAALALSAAAVAVCLLVERFDHGLVPFFVLIPAVIVEAIFFGTGPALAGAAAGWAATSFLVFGDTLAGPTPTRMDVAVLSFWPSCLTVIWAASLLRQAAMQAATAEARLAEVFRQIPGAAAIIEAPDGRLLLRSSQSDAVLGQPEAPMRAVEDLGGYGGLHEDGSLYAPEDYPIARALRDGTVVQAEPLRYRRLDGGIADLEVYAGPVRAGDGGVVAAVGMAFDVSKRVEAERRLQNSETRHRAIAERLGAAIEVGQLGLWELDVAGRLLTIDARCAAMLGLPTGTATLSYEELERFADPEEIARAGAVFGAAMAADAPYADELRLRTMDGQARWFVVSGAVSAGAARVAGVVRDATLRREREDALQAALDAREVLMREADHRIKNSLQLVVSLLRLQLGQVREPEAKEALRAAMTRVEAVGEAHLALQRSPDLKRLDLGQILHDLARRLGLLNPGVTVHCDAAAGVMLDAQQAVPLGLIASELVTNAMRHAFPHGAAGTVRLSMTWQAEVLDLTVVDDGVGLGPNGSPKGLGSTVVTALARQVGATVDRTSIPGCGTTVSLRMKLAMHAVR